MSWSPWEWLLFGLIAWPIARWLAARRRTDAVPLRPARPWEWALAGGLALVGFAGPIRHWQVFVGPTSPLPRDASSHAVVAQAIARFGLERGWIDTFNGGFPFALHYPPLPALLDAGLISLGLSARVATHALGLSAALATPLAFLFVARRLRIGPLGAAVGACSLSTVSPFSAFQGTVSGYSHAGLLSQSLGVFLATVLCGVLVDASTTWLVVALAALLAATHPQIAIVFLLVFAPLVMGQGRRAALHHVVAAVAAGISMLALYGPGITSLRVPIGWVVGEPWQQVGYPPARLDGWLVGGGLLDSDRAPILTCTWAFAAAGLATYPFGARIVALTLRAAGKILPTLASRCPSISSVPTTTSPGVDRRTARIGVTSLATSALGVILSVSGGVLLSMGWLGDLALRVFQPLRALATIPLGVALVCAVAAHEVTSLLRNWTPASRVGRTARACFIAGAVGLGLVWLLALASERWDRASESAEMRQPSVECGESTPDGYSTAETIRWVSTLSRGRFTFDSTTPMGACPAVRGLELASPVPLGGTFGLGAHVGIHAVAFDAVRLRAPGSAARAETLGLRTILHTRQSGPVDNGWIPLQERGEMVLSERVGGTDLIGVACVRERWRGSNASLHEALVADLRGPASVIASPTSVVVLEQTSGPIERTNEDSSGCDIAGTVVSEVPGRTPGRLEAIVSAPASVWVTVRATATPAWVITVDDRTVPAAVIAPGFLAARLPPGEHHVIAEVRWPRGYFAGIGFACLALIVLARLTQAGVRGRASAGGRPRLNRKDPTA